MVQDSGQRALRLDLLHVVLGQAHGGGFDDPRGEQGLERLGHGQGDQARPGPPGGRAHEQRRAGKVE